MNQNKTVRNMQLIKLSEDNTYTASFKFKSGDTWETISCTGTSDKTDTRDIFVDLFNGRIPESQMIALLDIAGVTKGLAERLEELKQSSQEQSEAYKIYHDPTDTWVSDLHIEYGDYEYDDPYLTDIEFVGYDEKEDAKTFYDTNFSVIRDDMLAAYNMRKMYENEAYMFYSSDVKGWLSHFNTKTDSHIMEFSRHSDMAIKITDSEKIEWLRENTKLEAVRVNV